MSEDEKILRIKELVTRLNEASLAYYQLANSIMSDREYDELLDELQGLEEETGFVQAISPTQRVGYEVVSALPKQRHPAPMLSLAKTKSREEIRAWLGENKGLLSWKMDGLTVVLTYTDGKLSQAVTRGNGEIGEVITANAKTFVNLPLSIPFKGELVLRGEAVIGYRDFEEINSTIEDFDSRFKNPRNLCSGSVRALDSRITAERRVHFCAFALVSAQGADFENSRRKQFEFLKRQGFETVEYRLVDSENVISTIDDFQDRIKDNAYPSDGLVLLLEDIAYGEALGRTAKTPRNAIAFKWADEVAFTTLKEIEWSPSRTGLINPVAVFEPVELEGTTVSRASVHNISVMRSLKLGCGDRIGVYKANMIIPQISENLTGSDNIAIPEFCPVCGRKTVVNKENDTETLFCPNEECSAKQIKGFTQFVSRDAMNIEGLSEQTLEKFLSKGFIKSFPEVYELSAFAPQISALEGFGEKSCSNILESIEKSRDTNLARVLYGVGIPGVGVATAKLLAADFDYEPEPLMQADEERLALIDGIGGVMAADIAGFFKDERKKEEIGLLLTKLRLSKPDIAKEGEAAGRIFVVTGSLEHFKSRKELTAYIESIGGKVTGSVSAKTDFLINNDVTSSSSKNKKARELGIEIISEETFIEKFGE